VGLILLRKTAARISHKNRSGSFRGTVTAAPESSLRSKSRLADSLCEQAVDDGRCKAEYGRGDRGEELAYFEWDPSPSRVDIRSYHRV
jgi:hypothetical protein